MFQKMVMQDHQLDINQTMDLLWEVGHVTNEAGKTRFPPNANGSFNLSMVGVGELKGLQSQRRSNSACTTEDLGSVLASDRDRK